MKRMAAVLCGVVAFLALGCAPISFLTIRPGLVDVSPSSAQKEPTERWTFWVRNVTDERERQAGTPAIGLFDQRFVADNTQVFLDQPPGDYVRSQLSRFLLNRGMEASSQEKATVLLDLSISKFAISRDSTTALDKVVFEVDYRVNFSTPDGQQIGAVRLPDGRWFKSVSLFGSQARIESLVRETMGDTFKRLAESEIYATAAKK